MAVRRAPISRAFTLIELLVVIAIIAILAAILFPIFGTAKERGRTGKCMAHLRQVAVALHEYVADWNDRFPPSRFSKSGAIIQYPHPHVKTWKESLAPFVKGQGVWTCPSNLAYKAKWGQYDGMDETGLYPISYAYNSAVFEQNMSPDGTLMSELDKTSTIIFMVESRYHAPDLGPWCLDYKGGWQYPAANGGKGFVQIHTGGRANWIFCDLHVSSLTVPDTCTPRSLWGINIRGPKKEGRLWADQRWWDNLVASRRLAPEYY